MNYFLLTRDQQEWKERAVGIAERDLGPRAAHYDREAAFPQESLNALRDAPNSRAALWTRNIVQQGSVRGCRECCIIY